MTGPGVMAMNGSPDEAKARLDQWADGLSAKAAKYESVARQTEGLRLSATSVSNFVKVTVRADGSVTDLEFGPKARTVPMPELATLILDTMRRAQAGIAGRVGDVLAAELGDEDPQTRELMLAELRGRFPDPDDEPQEPESDTAQEDDAAQDEEPW
ncbi:YbaB/EbfC family nucleoid-associated protein [Amycolatopsis sp.]|uniref:YbaB/EbfC family nucleoid-associated protein n=1 Tax=Amycolatopsis sp. TaxID=37632 RepID=UPI002D7E942B|nr:YbaB/EbfC family nucleoid-associated protein [Amycolatopsis sp.]HET6706170.1 YbaB/EbfC family nucleoid-associated protein [Amycolatopsis sp.]